MDGIEAMIMHARPLCSKKPLSVITEGLQIVGVLAGTYLTLPIPVTILAAGVESSPYPAKGANSRKGESGSRSNATLSLAAILISGRYSS